MNLQETPPLAATQIELPLASDALGEPFKEPEFFNALLGIWLGNAPADWKLKDALLGKTAPSPS